MDYLPTNLKSSYFGIKILLQLFNLLTDEGPTPESSVWSILLTQCDFKMVTCADPEGGEGVRNPLPLPPPPPWDLSEVGSCVDIWWVGEGVHILFYLTFIFFFWLAPLASIHSVNIWKIRITSKFKGMSLLPSYTLSLAFIKVPFPCLFCLKLHDFTPLKPKNFWRRIPRLPSLWLYLHIFAKLYRNTIISNVLLPGENTSGRHIYKNYCL